MGFRFRLEAVLRQRRNVVDEVAARLGHALRLVRQEQEHLDVLQDASARYQAAYEAALAPGALDLDRLRTGAAYAAFLDRAIGEQTQRIAEMNRRADAIRELLVQAEQDRQVLENLKERQRRAWYEALTAEERRYFDSVANTMYTAKHQAHMLLEGG